MNSFTGHILPSPATKYGGGDRMRLPANGRRVVERDCDVLQRKIDINSSIEGILPIHPYLL
jgi:hypothetical protein